MLAATLTSVIESVGDYYACARICGAPPPPVHAVNRGVTVEGLGGLLSGIFGSGGATTSYSQNIGAIGFAKVDIKKTTSVYPALFIAMQQYISCITFLYNLMFQVGSRRVFLLVALLFIVSGVCGKFGALLTMMPDPILGAVLVVGLAMVSAVGISNLQFVDAASSRNQCIIGLSLMMGMIIPNWLKKHPNAIATCTEIRLLELKI